MLWSDSHMLSIFKNLSGVTEGIFHAQWSPKSVSATYNTPWRIKRQTREDRHALANAKPCWVQFFPTGHPLQNTCPLVTIVPPVCLLADTSNNPDIWPASKLITTLDGIDPSSRGFPSRAVCFCCLLQLIFIWLLVTLFSLLFPSFLHCFYTASYYG